MFNRKINAEIDELWDYIGSLAHTGHAIAKLNRELANIVHQQEHRIAELEDFLYEEDEEDDECETCNC